MKKILFVNLFLIVFLLVGCFDLTGIDDKKIIDTPNEKTEEKVENSTDYLVIDEKDFLTYVVLLAAEENLKSKQQKLNQLIKINDSTKPVYAITYPFDFIEIYSVESFKIEAIDDNLTYIEETCGDDLEVIIAEFMPYMYYEGRISSLLWLKESLLIFKGDKGVFSCITGTYTLSSPDRIFTSYKRLENNELIKDFTLPIHEFIVCDNKIEYYLLEGEGEKWADEVSLTKTYQIKEETKKYNTDVRMYEVSSLLDLVITKKVEAYVSSIENNTIEINLFGRPLTTINISEDTNIFYNKQKLSLSDLQVGSNIFIIYKSFSDDEIEVDALEIRVIQLTFVTFKEGTTYADIVEIYGEPESVHTEGYVSCVFKLNKYESVSIAFKEVYVDEELDLENCYFSYAYVYFKLHEDVN